LIASGTVEEKIVQMQLQKAKLLQELWEASDAAHQSLSLDEFKSLFEL
jgi:SNF2 family DNA or RNA helicase